MDQVREDAAIGPDRRSMARVRHDEDLYTWVQEQIALLRAGQVRDIDARNIAEELSDVGRSEYSKLESALTVLLTHMLKWEYQPERRTRSWDNTIAIQRQHYGHVLADNPGLKSKREEALARAYSVARLEASNETNPPRAAFPTACPFDWDDILRRSFAFDPEE